MKNFVYGFLFLLFVAVVSFYVIPTYIGGNNYVSFFVVLLMCVFGYFIGKYVIKSNNV